MLGAGTKVPPSLGHPEVALLGLRVPQGTQTGNKSGFDFTRDQCIQGKWNQLGSEGVHHLQLRLPLVPAPNPGPVCHPEAIQSNSSFLLPGKAHCFQEPSLYSQLQATACLELPGWLPLP